jgi:YidC/Oxa1 family membrane protein insertase
MAFWEQLVGILREAIFAYTISGHGNIGSGIAIVTLLARLAFLPLAIRLARAAAEHQAVVQKIQPELDALRARYKNDPHRVAEETQRVYRREGISILPGSSLLGTLVQIPMLLALYSAVRQAAAIGSRFFWIADISRPDRLLTVLVTAIGAAAAAAGTPPSTPHRFVSVVLPAAITVFALSRMAAGVGIYWGVSSLVGVVQALAVRRRGSDAV